MNRKFYFSFLAFALTLAATVAFVVGHSVRTRAAAPNAALNALPASDFVVAIDAQRALNETLPSILAGNSTLLAKINSHLDEFEKKTGINPRSIESIAIGGRFNSSRADVAHGVLIARGSFNSDALIDAAFTAASAKMQFQKEEQEYQGKKIFLISDPTVSKLAAYKPTIPPAQPGSGTGFGPGVKKDSNVSDLEILEGKKEAAINYKAVNEAGKFAVTALDANTIAIGDLQSVQAAIDASMGGNHVDDQLVQLATQTPNAVVGFSGKVPQNFTEKFGAPGNNPAAKYFASIREFYGSYAVNGTDAENMIALRTENADQARDISQAINALKTLSAVGMSQSTNNSSTPQNAFVTALNGMSVTAQDNEVRIAFKIPQASLAPFMHLH